MDVARQRQPDWPIGRAPVRDSYHERAGAATWHALVGVCASSRRYDRGLVMARVGIAIPSYCSATTLEATLRSIAAQSYTDWYCVVVNDGAEDGSTDVVSRLRDPRIRYVCDGERRGQLRNFNRAILEVLREDAEIVRLFSADDVMYAHSLEDTVRVFDAHASVGLVASYYDGIDASGRLVFRSAVERRPDRVMAGRAYLLIGVSVGNTIGGPSSVALRRSAIETAGLFDPRIDFSGDADLWHRVAASWDVAWVGRRTGFMYRLHDASVTGRGTYTVGRFADKIQVVRRVAATEALLGPRWWAHQYMIGYLHAINLQVIAAMAARGRWKGVRAGLVTCIREGLLLYAPFWIPRIPWQMARWALGLPPTRRVLWRRAHESLQPPKLPVPAEVPAQEQRRAADLTTTQRGRAGSTR